MNQLKKLVFEIKSNEDLMGRFNDDQLKFLEDRADKIKHPIWNEKIYMTVVYIVGAAFLLSVILGSAMIFNGEHEEVDNFYVMIASTCIGALAGLLAPSPKDTQEVTK